MRFEVIVFAMIFWIGCAATPVSVTEFEPPIPVIAPNVPKKPYPCILAELEQFHKRCKVIYNRPDYCVRKLTKKTRPDGSVHLNIICGVQNDKT